jgi:hypothetical protein
VGAQRGEQHPHHQEVMTPGRATAIIGKERAGI